MGLVYVCLLARPRFFHLLALRVGRFPNIVYGRMGIELRDRVRERGSQLGGGGAVREKRQGIRGKQRSHHFLAVAKAGVIDRAGETTYCYCMKIFVVKCKFPRSFYA